MSERVVIQNKSGHKSLHPIEREEKKRRKGPTGPEVDLTPTRSSLLTRIVERARVSKL